LDLSGLNLVVWFMVCGRCEACVHGYWFVYMWDACERWSVLAIGVRPVSSWPLVIVSNIGVWSCLDVV
jgi:hypothetical protein